MPVSKKVIKMKKEINRAKSVVKKAKVVMKAMKQHAQIAKVEIKNNTAALKKAIKENDITKAVEIRKNIIVKKRIIIKMINMKQKVASAKLLVHAHKQQQKLVKKNLDKIKKARVMIAKKAAAMKQTTSVIKEHVITMVTIQRTIAAEKIILE